MLANIMTMGSKKWLGFTIIEIVVVVAIVGITLPAIFAILFNLLRLNLQLSQLQRVKEVGDYVSNVMISTVRRNAIRVDESCSDGVLQGVLSDPNIQSSILFRDRYDVCFGYYLKEADDSGITTVTLASVSAALSPTSNYSTPLVVNDASDNFPLTVTDLEFDEIDPHLARVNFKLVSTPKVEYIQPQELSYQYYIYIRN